MIGRAAIVVLGAIALLITIASHARADIATWYGNESGSQTTSGERFNENADTCALPSYRRGQPERWMCVTYRDRTVACRVNDRGPAAWTGASIDVSKGVARKLGFIVAGRVKVRIEPCPKPS